MNAGPRPPWGVRSRSIPEPTALFPLTAAPPRPYAGSASRPDGRRFRSGGKSGLQTDAAPDNVRRGRPQGKRHRKQTAHPAGRKVGRMGKGERVRQERTARAATSAARQAPPGARPNRSDARAALGPRAGPHPLALSLGLVARGARRRASQRNGRHVGAKTPAIQNPAYRPAGVPFVPRPCWRRGNGSERGEHAARGQGHCGGRLVGRAGRHSWCSISTSAIAGASS